MSDLLHRSITRLRSGHRIRGLKSIGIDEILYCKGHKCATVVYDLDRFCIAWVGKGKGRETIDNFFGTQLGEHQKSQVKRACCDMSETNIGAIERHLPNATQALDCFHIVRAFIAAVDEVRKQQSRNALDSDHKVLKGLCWLLYRHSGTRTLNAFSKGNRRIHRAWVLKDEFEQFWDFKTSLGASRFWMTMALKSRLEPLRDFVQALKKHFFRIVAFISFRLTNAISEGLNRIIKIVKNRTSGFRNLNAFSDLYFMKLYQWF